MFVDSGEGREPKPFLRNAVDNNQDSINKAIVESVSKSVGKKDVRLRWIYLRAYTSTCLPTAR